VILATLPIAPSGPGDPMEVLLRELRGREMLLVIDGVEHLLPAARGLLRSILDAAPRTVILLTSRSESVFRPSAASRWRASRPIRPPSWLDSQRP